MPKLSATDQLKALRDDIREYQSLARLTGMRVELINDKLKSISTDLNDLKKDTASINKRLNNHIENDRQDNKSINQRFDDLEHKLSEWKSDLFTKIDKSYAKPIRDLQEESAAQQVRQNRQQQEIDKTKLIALNQ